MVDPNLRNIAMTGLRDAVGKNDAHTILCMANDWMQKGVITSADVAEITGLLNGGNSGSSGNSGSNMKQYILNRVGHYSNFQIARDTMNAVAQELLTTADAEEIYAAMSAASGAGST